MLNRKLRGAMSHGNPGNPTVISAGTTIHGDIRFDGELVVEGKVIGSIVADDGSKALLRVAENGLVEGDIEVPLVVINGSVNGNVRSFKHVELAARGVVNGNVSYNIIEMVMGSAVNGSLSRVNPDEAEVALLEVDQNDQPGG